MIEEGTSWVWLLHHGRRRVWPGAATFMLVLIAMAYSFWWGPLVRHASEWVVPGDVWSTFRAAHWIGWGDLGGVYGSDTALVTFPGIAVLLAPLAMISGSLGLSESISPIFLAHPTAWYVLGPVVLLLGSTCLFALDAVAEQLGVSGRRRAVLCWFEVIVVFQVVALWGHPEDLLAFALALYALMAGSQKRFSLSAWLWGAAIVVQPLVILVFPLALARTQRGRRIRLVALAAVPSIVLVGTPLVSQWRVTSRAILRQPNYEYLDHATPWVALSPHLSRVSVGAGPGRMAAVLVAVLFGVAAARRPPAPAGFIWLCAFALAIRCLFEAVMVPFYLGPPLALIILAASLRAERWRMVAAWIVAMVATVFAFHRFSEWLYWTPIAALLVIALATAWPGWAAFCCPDGALTNHRIRLGIDPSVTPRGPLPDAANLSPDALPTSVRTRS